MKRSDLTPPIKAPTFKVNNCVLNEYELRNMQIRIAKGILNPKGLVVTDSQGNIATIDSDGTLICTALFPDLLLADNLVHNLFMETVRNKSYYKHE